MPKKRKSRFDSLSTPGKKQDLSNYLVELAFTRQNRGQKMPPNFWRLVKYKFRYRREIQACRKFIKKYGEAFVLYVALNNHITRWTDFGRIEFLLQKLQEKQEAIKSPKDFSPVEEESLKVKEDFRDFKPKPAKVGLFKRLEELNGKEKEE